MFYDARFSHVSRFEFLKAHPRVHCDLRYARVFIVEKIDFAERNKGITAYTRKSVRMGYDVRGTEGEVEKRKGRRTKRKEQKRTQKRAPELVPFAFIRSLRGHSALYCISSSADFLLSTSFPSPACQSFLLPFPRFSIPRLRHRSLHRAPHVRADYALSSRNYFAYMPLPFSLSLPLSVIPPTITYPLSLSSHGTITRPSVKYTFVGGPAMWRPVIYFSSNCNFSNTYCPLDKCASLFLTR